MNQDLEKIVKWLNACELITNVRKIKHLWMNGNVAENIILHDIKLGNKVIEKVSASLNLGIVIDDKPNFKEQVSNCAKKTASEKLICSLEHSHLIRKILSFIHLNCHSSNTFQWYTPHVIMKK